MLDYIDINEIITKQLRNNIMLKENNIKHDARMRFDRDYTYRRIRLYNSKCYIMDIYYKPLLTLTKEEIAKEIEQQINEYIKENIL